MLQKAVLFEVLKRSSSSSLVNISEKYLRMKIFLVEFQAATLFKDDFHQNDFSKIKNTFVKQLFKGKH